MLCMLSSIFEKVVITIIKPFLVHCRPQMSFSKFQNSTQGSCLVIETEIQLGTDLRIDYWGGGGV